MFAIEAAEAEISRVLVRSEAKNTEMQSPYFKFLYICSLRAHSEIAGYFQKL